MHNKSFYSWFPCFCMRMEMSEKLSEKEIDNIIEKVEDKVKPENPEERKKDRLKAEKEQREVKEVREAFEKAKEYPGQQVGGKGGGKSIEKAEGYYSTRGDGEIPEEKVKEGEKVTVEDMIEEGKYYSKGETEKSKRYKEMGKALRKAEKTLRGRKKGQKQEKPVEVDYRKVGKEEKEEVREDVSKEEKRKRAKEIAREVMRNQEDLFRVEKARYKVETLPYNSEFREEVYAPGWGKLRREAKKGNISMGELENIIKKAGNKRTQKKYEEFLEKKAKYDAGQEILNLVNKANKATKTNTYKKRKMRKAREKAKRYGFNMDKIIRRKGGKRLKGLWNRELKKKDKTKKGKRR